MRSSEIEERFCERGQQKNAIIRSNMAEMGRQVTVVLYAVAMAAIIVGVDLAFFRNDSGNGWP